MPVPRRTRSATGRIAPHLAIIATIVITCRASATPSDRTATADDKRLEVCWIDLERGDVEASRRFTQPR